MVPSETKKFRADAPPLGACENIVGCSQTGGQFANGRGNLVDTTFEGFLEQSRLRIMHELRRCSEVDTHEAAQIGELEKNCRAQVQQKISQTRRSRKGWKN